MNKQVIYIDASLYSEADCERKMFLIQQGYRNKYDGNEDHKTGFGTAFHNTVADIYRKLFSKTTDARSINDIINEHMMVYLDRVTPPEGDHRDAVYLRDVCRKYYKERIEGSKLTPLIVNDKPMVERPFVLPLHTTPTHDFLLVGTCDFLGTDGHDYIFLDYKTSVMPAYKIFANQETKPQLAVYTYALNKIYPEKKFKAVIEHVHIPKSKQTVFTRSQKISIEDDVIDTVMADIINLCKQYVTIQGLGKPNYRRCETKFGMCQFYGACKHGKESLVRLKLNDYDIVPYEPANFQLPSHSTNKN